MLDVFKIATPEEREDTDYAWFRVDPDQLYPAALTHVAGALAQPRPAEPLGQLWDRGQAVGVQAFQEAPLGRPGSLPRAEALEVARLWFTEMLHQAAGAPIGVHILKGSGAWRL